MPNNLAPFGFRPARHVSGTGHRLNKHYIASGHAENIAIGDLVKTNAGGTIAKAAPGDAILGTFAGWQFDTQDGLNGMSFEGSMTGMIPFAKVWKSGTTATPGNAIICWVHDDPSETFEVQTSATVVAADVGAFVDLVDAAPDTLFGASRQTVGGPGGAQFRIERILQKPMRFADAGNNTTGWGLSGVGQYALIEVRTVKHERGGPAMAVAV